MVGWTPPDPRQQHGSPAQVGLMRAFQFDAADLDANRRGQLSARQRRNQRLRWRWMRITAVAAATVSGLSLVALPRLLGGTGLGLGLSGADAVGAWVALALASGLLGGSLLYGYWQMRHQLADRVYVADGVAGVPRAGGRGATRHVTVVPVGAAEVSLVDEARLEAMAPGAAYRVYYLPGPVIEVLSIEPVEARPATNV